MIEIIQKVRQLIKDVDSRNKLRIKNVEEREIQQMEKEMREKKRQLEEDRRWAETRETRVGTWRKFHTGGPKKKKARQGDDGLL